MTAFPNYYTVAVKRLENSVWIFNHFQLREGCKGLKRLDANGQTCLEMVDGIILHVRC